VFWLSVNGKKAFSLGACSAPSARGMFAGYRQTVLTVFQQQQTGLGRSLTGDVRATCDRVAYLSLSGQRSRH